MDGQTDTEIGIRPLCTSLCSRFPLSGRLRAPRSAGRGDCFVSVSGIGLRDDREQASTSGPSAWKQQRDGSPQTGSGGNQEEKADRCLACVMLCLGPAENRNRNSHH